MCEPKTIVSYIPEKGPSSCGYCSGLSSYSSGMWAHYMSVDMYQKLIDRGWRRSGRYVYKPKMTETCCPLYTIRCHAGKYKPSKSQKKVAKKVKNFLLHGKKEKAENLAEMNGASKNCELGASHKAPSNMAATDKDSSNIAANDKTQSQIAPPTDKASDETATNPESEERRVLGLKKAKIRRIERRLEKKRELNCDTKKQEKVARNSEKQICDYLPDLQTTTGSLNKAVGQSESEENYKHQLTLRLVKADPKDPDFRKYFKESYGVFKKYQMAVHKDKEEKCSEGSFLNFLCDSPLVYQQSKEKDLLMGAFHQHYLIDNKIVAVGVLDILPGCVSSVYFYYDPDYSHLSLGTYSAIREIQLCEKLGIEFYYMGYYVHSCPKMRYKGKYDPSDLCSPESYIWYDIGKCTPKLDENKYSSFEGGSYSAPHRNPALQKIMIYFEGDIVTYSEGLLSSLSRREQDKMTEFLERVEDLAEGMIVVVSGRDDDSDSD